MLSLLPLIVQAPKIPYRQELAIFQGNTLLPISHQTDKNTVYSVLYAKDEEYTSKEIKELIREKYPELYWIVYCESTFRPEVCSYAGCQVGMGLIQVIPSSLKLCEKELKRKLDPFNVMDNLECGKFLLKIQGENAWKSSQQCWKKYQ